MPTTPPTPNQCLERGLEALYLAARPGERVQQDPVRYPRRYTHVADVELATSIAAMLAFGRVASFFQVLDPLFARLDRAGGPAQALATTPTAKLVRGLSYRFLREADLGLLLAGLQRVVAAHGSLGAAFAGDSAYQVLEQGITRLREAVVAISGVQRVDQLPHGVRHALPLPSGGSACKRWNMALRWLVRPPSEGVDLGVWTHLRPADLIVPLDVHVHRIARLIGLTHRATPDWRAAASVTQALRQIDPGDPVRFDFALAHLGISGQCRAIWRVECGNCPLHGVCSLALPTRRATRARESR